MSSKSLVSLAFVASLMAAPAAFAASTDLPPPPAPAPMDQSMAAPAPAPMNQGPMNQGPMDQGMTAGAPQTNLVTNGPQGDPGDHAANWSAARNVQDSQRYDRLVATSPGFRRARENKECGPINDAQLHASCVATFENGAEARMSGSSTPPHPIRNSSGASE